MLGRLISLLTAFVLAWFIVDRGLASWVQHEDAIVGQVARYVPQSDPEQLQSLLSLGEPDAPMTAVLACDPALARCRRQLAQLIAWQGQTSKLLGHGVDDSSGTRRLVYLPRPDARAGTQVGQTVHALDAQGHLWKAVPTLAQDPTTWTPATLDRSLHAIAVDPKRLARDRDDPETVLAVQIERTMAEALEIPQESGVLLAGLPVAATQSEGPGLAAALDGAEAELAANIQFYSGDVALGQARGLAKLSDRTRDRFIRWILVGKKVSSLSGTGSDAPPSGDDDGGEEDDEAP